jgi:hypothetical protein
MKRGFRYFPITLGLLLVGWLWSRMPPDPSRIRFGDSEAQVIALLGRPEFTRDYPDTTAWGIAPVVLRVNSGECVREFVYYPGGMDASAAWRVGFDLNGRVVSNYGHRSSPGRWVNVVGRLPTMMRRAR